MTEPIEVQRVGLQLAGRVILDQVNFTVPGTCVCALLGPNGAGKTSLLRCLSGALTATYGRCLLAGRDSARDAAVADRFAYVPDHPAVEDGLRVREHLLLHARLRGIPQPHADRIREVLRVVDLEMAADRLAGTLSRGQQGRLAMAEALLHRPDILLLDEPSAGLDPAQLVALRALLERLRSRCSILLSSHNLSEVAAVCDRVVVMAAGRVRFDGTVADLSARAHSLEQAYLDLVEGEHET